MIEKYQKLIYNIKLSSFVDMKMEVGFKNLTINIENDNTKCICIINIDKIVNQNH